MGDKTRLGICVDDRADMLAKVTQQIEECVKEVVAESELENHNCHSGILEKEPFVLVSTVLNMVTCLVTSK